MLFKHFIVIYVYHSSRDIVYLIQKQYKQTIHIFTINVRGVTDARAVGRDKLFIELPRHVRNSVYPFPVP